MLYHINCPWHASRIDAKRAYHNLYVAGLDISGVNPEERDVGPGRTALAAVASEPAAVDAVFPAPARSRSVSDAHAPWKKFFLKCNRQVFAHLKQP